MSRSAQRVQLARGYVLHRRPFRDHSLIVEVFARDYGHFTVFARAARGPRSKLTLQPFSPLLLSWNGRGEAPQLTGAEPDGLLSLPAAQLWSGFYLNELLLKLLTRHDPHPELFDHYETTLRRLAAGGGEGLLRAFEIRLLDLIGYGLNLAAEVDTGEAVRPEAQYRFRAGVHGVVLAGAEQEGSTACPLVSGAVLQDLAAGVLPEEADALRQARALMRAALDHCLEGRELVTRSVARAVHDYPRRERVL